MKKCSHIRKTNHLRGTKNIQTNQKLLSLALPLSIALPPPLFNAVVIGGYDGDGVHAAATVDGGASEALRCTCGLRDIS